MGKVTKKKIKARYITDKKDFTLFCAEVEKWVAFFGLSDWSVTCVHSNDSEVKHACGFVTYNIYARLVSIHLVPDWEGEIVTEFGIRQVAFHEVCHVLFADVSALGEARYVQDVESIDTAYHSLIKRLENTIFKLDFNGNIKVV